MGRRHFFGPLSPLAPGAKGFLWVPGAGGVFQKIGRNRRQAQAKNGPHGGAPFATGAKGATGATDPSTLALARVLRLILV